MQALKYAPLLDSSNRHRSTLRSLQFLAGLFLRHLLHAVILFVVLSTPNIWSSPVYYLLASNGMLYVCYCNVSEVLSAPEGQWLKAAARHTLGSGAAMTMPSA